MVHVLGDRHLRQQAGIGLAAVDDRRGHHLLAGPAGVLRVHVALDVKLQRLAASLSLTCSPIATSAPWHCGQVHEAGSCRVSTRSRCSGSGLRRATARLRRCCVVAASSPSAWIASTAAMSADIVSSNSARCAGSMRSDLAENCSRRSRAISAVRAAISASRWVIVRSRASISCACCWS